MKIVLTNMCMIYDKDRDRVLVLDKKIKYGWEGLTFPGGHVEPGESFYDSCLREVKEETNLDVGKLDLRGIIQWYVLDREERHIGYLYFTEDFSGKLIKDNREGKLFWMELEEFLEKSGKSQSMDDCLSIYLGRSKEIIRYYEKNQLISKKIIK